MMFQRMLIIVNNSISKLKKGSLNTARNVKFSDAIAKICKVSPDISIPEPECNVLDGDSLLQRIPWTEGEIFRELKSTYICIVLRYVNLIYYTMSTQTKQVSRMRHQKRVSVEVSPRMKLALKKDKKSSMSNAFNKQDFG